jgi:methyltransferase
VLFLKRPFPGLPGLAALIVALGAQALRWWAIGTLGWRWNTRIIVVPGAPPVTGGPYRFVRHPNYVAVVLEIASIPLIHGAWLTALIFSALNVALLAVRIPAEERALGRLYAEAFEGRSRLLPEVRTRDIREGSLPCGPGQLVAARHDCCDAANARRARDGRARRRRLW